MNWQFEYVEVFRNRDVEQLKGYKEMREISTRYFCVDRRNIFLQLFSSMVSIAASLPLPCCLCSPRYSLPKLHLRLIQAFCECHGYLCWWRDLYVAAQFTKAPAICAGLQGYLVCFKSTEKVWPLGVALNDVILDLILSLLPFLPLLLNG